MTVTHFVVSVHQYGGGDLIWNGVRVLKLIITPKGSSQKKKAVSNEGKSSRRERYKPNILKTFFIVVDINECALYPGTCPFPSRCRNTIGGHTCECPKGFVMDRQKICVGQYTCVLQTLNMLQGPKLASRSPTDKSTDGRPVNPG